MVTGSWLLCVTASAILSVCIVAARGEPPAGSDGALAPFYRSLKVPKTNGSCCDVSDCRPVVTRWKGKTLWAFVGGQFPNNPQPNWREVPEGSIIHGVANQAGADVLCWYGGEVLCFLPGGSS